MSAGLKAVRGVRPLLLAVLLAGPFALAYFAGGYFDEPRLWAGLVACALLVGAALCTRRPLPATLPGRLSLAGLVLLTAWTAASIAWAPVSAASVPDTDRLLLYAAGYAAALALLDSRAAVRALEPALAFGCLAVIVYGLSERLLPGVFTLRHDISAAGRLAQPLTYWNAMGSMAALGFVLAARLAGDATRPRAMRVAGAAAAAPLGLGVYLSFSRGALAALAVGVILLAVLGRGRPQWRALATALAAGVVAAVVGGALDGVRALEGTTSSRESDGAIMLAVLVACCVTGALVQLAATRREVDAQALRAQPLSRGRRRLVVGALVAAVAVGAALTLVFSERQPEPAPTGATAKRLTSVESNRSAYWRVALDAFAHHPLKGVGSGGFRVEWLRHRAVAEPAQDAHSIYVETAAELGIVGLAALTLFLGGAIWAAVRAYARDPVLAAGLAAGLSVWLVHAGLDWLWEMPSVSAPALLLAAGLVRRAEAQPAALSSTA